MSDQRTRNGVLANEMVCSSRKSGKSEGGGRGVCVRNVTNNTVNHATSLASSHMPIAHQPPTISHHFQWTQGCGCAGEGRGPERSRER